MGQTGCGGISQLSSLPKLGRIGCKLSLTALLFEFWDPYPLEAFEEAPADAFLSLSEDDDSSPSAVKEKII